MKSIAMSALISGLVLSSGINAAPNFELTKGKPGGGECRFTQDLGKTMFDANSGRLWSCGNEGWVYFESQPANTCLQPDPQILEGIPAWKSGAYNGGQQVQFEGKVYEAKWWTRAKPGTSSTWRLLTQNNDVPDVWVESVPYSSNDRVVYMGHVYQARQWSKGVNPAQDSLNLSAPQKWNRKWDWKGEFHCPAK